MSLLYDISQLRNALHVYMHILERLLERVADMAEVESPQQIMPSSPRSVIDLDNSSDSEEGHSPRRYLRLNYNPMPH
jgi:hypothetical protein